MVRLHQTRFGSGGKGNGPRLGDNVAGVRVIHTSPDAPAVDITTNDSALAVFGSIELGEIERLRHPARHHVLSCRFTGTEDKRSGIVFEAELTPDSAPGAVFTEGYLLRDDESILVSRRPRSH